MDHHFTLQLLHKVTADLTRYHPANIDVLRFSDEQLPLLKRLKQKLATMADRSLAKLGWVRNTDFHRRQFQRRIDELEPYLAGLEWFYQRLADAASKNTLVEVIAYRLLGHRHTQLARNNAAFWSALETLESKTIARAKVARMNTLNGWLDDYDLSSCGFDLRLRAHRLNVLNTFLLEQYRFNEKGAPTVGVKPGDIVVDGGGCWGDTTLYFAHETGPAGQVHVFEFSPANLLLMDKNLAANPSLAGQVRIHKEALWNTSGETLSFSEAGPSTALGGSTGTLSTATLTIDDWAANHKIPRVDFIKLDIEGAEGQALEGARQIIRQHKPRLAVALYHSLEDFVKLPQLIDSILPEYRFHLGHYTIHAEETILFATCE